MERDFNREELFWQYYEKWIEVYKKGAVRDITLNKYMMTLTWLKKLAPDLVVSDLNRVGYQTIINTQNIMNVRQQWTFIIKSKELF